MRGRRAPELRRRRHTREPKRRFIVYCEGENTEPAYLGALRRACADALIEIETIGAVGVPQTVARQATERVRAEGLGRRRGRPLSSFEEGDQVWAVFDRDDHEGFQEAVNRCEQAGVFVGRSNPCFELWLILHEQEYDKPDGRDAVQAHLQRLRPEYDRRRRKLPDCTALIALVEAAEARAESQLERREEERAPYGRPSTTVGRLTRAIREAADRARSD